MSTLILDAKIKESSNNDLVAGLSQETVKKINPRYIASIILIITSLLMVVVGSILFKCCISVPIGLLLICVGLALFLLSCCFLKNIDRYILHKQIDKKPPPICLVLTVFPGSKFPIWGGNDITERIKKNINTIASAGTLDISPGNHLNLLFDNSIDNYSHALVFRDDTQYSYKLSYVSRNYRRPQAMTRVKHFYQSNGIAKSVCIEHDLDTLFLPEMSYMPIPLTSSPTLVYDLIIEERLSFAINETQQRSLYRQSSDEFKKRITQLTKFICLTGCSSIDFDNIAINPKSQDIYLLNLDINLEVTIDNIEIGLFGSNTKRGLIHCLGSKELIDTALETAKSMNIDITTERAQKSINERLEYLQMQEDLEALYNDPPQPQATLQMLDDSILDTDIPGLLLEKEVYEHSMDILSSNIANIVNIDNLNALSENIKVTKKHGSDHIVLNLEDNDNVCYYSFYQENKIDYHIATQKVLNIYKTYILIDREIKNKNLKGIKIPKIKLLSFEHEGNKFYLLAVEKLDIIVNDESPKQRQLYNFHNYKGDALSAINSLFELNASIGLKINANNTFLIKGNEYELALINLERTNPVQGLLGDDKVRGYDVGLMMLANTEKVFTELLLKGAKIGILNKNLAEQSKETVMKWIQCVSQVRAFYDSDSDDDISLLENYLDYTLIANVADNSILSDEGINNVSMKDAVFNILDELERIVNKMLDNEDLKDDDIVSKRFMIKELENTIVLQTYNSVYFNSTNQPIPRFGSKPPSCLDLVKEALIACNLILTAYPEEVNNEITSRSQYNCIYWHI